MKLCRFGPAGAEKPGLVDSTGKVRDLSAHVSDIDGTVLSDAALATIKAIDPASLPRVPAGTRLGPPVANVKNFMAIGLNYTDHAKEVGAEIPKEPIIFYKLANCICGPNDDVMIPRGSKKLDWELEIAFVVGKRSRYVDLKDARSHIAGYTICNDISERHFQLERGGQWMKGKSAETFGPIGPWLVTRDEVADVNNLPMSLRVNGKTMQKGSTSTMIFNCDFILHYVSQFMVLEPGDVVTTGTPPGVGAGMKPPTYLKSGDVMKLAIEGLGTQQQKVVPFKL